MGIQIEKHVTFQKQIIKKKKKFLWCCLTVFPEMGDMFPCSFTVDLLRWGGGVFVVNFGIIFSSSP